MSITQFIDSFCLCFGTEIFYVMPASFDERHICIDRYWSLKDKGRPPSLGCSTHFTSTGYCGGNLNTNLANTITLEASRRARQCFILRRRPYYPEDFTYPEMMERMMAWLTWRETTKTWFDSGCKREPTLPPTVLRAPYWPLGGFKPRAATNFAPTHIQSSCTYLLYISG